MICATSVDGINTLVVDVMGQKPTKDNTRSRIAYTIQSAFLTENNLTKDERQALKQLKNDEEIMILPADKRRVTVVMEKRLPRQNGHTG